VSTEEFIFTAVIFIIALGYLYKSLIRKNGCGGSCGCGSNTKRKETK
jgi:hypothetical protein